jgi:hypothetical protein
MARLHGRNFGFTSRVQAQARSSILEDLGAGIATILSWVLLIGLGLVVLCWRLLHRILVLMIGTLPAPRFLLAARERFFRYRRRRWYCVQANRDEGWRRL